jgi:type II secretory pathway component PulM
MASPPAPLRAPLPLARWWSAKSSAERVLIATVAFLAIVAVGWLALWQPLTRDIAALRVANAREAAALAEARQATDEMAGLAREAAPPPSADPRADFERIVSQQGLRGALTQQEWKEGRASVVFGAVDFDALVATLEALQRDARLRVVEATIAARVEPGTVRAELVLAR